MRGRRVAVTGRGVISPLGNCIPDLAGSLLAGRSGVRRLETSWASHLKSPIAGQVDFAAASHFDAPRLRILDRVSQLALVAASSAVTESRLDFSMESRERCGTFVGTGMGGAQTTDHGYRALYQDQSDRIKPYTVLGSMTNAAAAWIAIEHGLAGPSLTYSTACSSSAIAIGEAARCIANGDSDVMVAGGAEAPLAFGVLRAWEALRTLATEDKDDPSASCRPFSLNRSGLVLSEGAAFVVLEDWEHANARGATVFAEFIGYGCTCDALHITQPSVEGQARAMKAALRSADMEPQEINYLNAHGTATIQNDATETSAIRQVFGDYATALPVSSTKSTHGHLLGAAGALEFLISILCLDKQFVPPTMNLNCPDPACDLDYVTEGARTGLKLRAVMSNSFAFGGTNAVLVARSGVGGF